MTTDAANFVTKAEFSSNSGGAPILLALEFISVVDGIAETYAIKNIDAPVSPFVSSFFADLVEFSENFLGVAFPFVSPKALSIAWRLEESFPRAFSAKVNCSTEIESSDFPFEVQLPKLDKALMVMFDDGGKIQNVSKMILQSYGEWLQSRPSQLSLLGMEPKPSDSGAGMRFLGVVNIPRAEVS